MITLEQLVGEQKLTGMSDIGIIKTFLDLNDMEEEGMELIHELTKSKVEKLKRKQRQVEEWTSYLPSRYLYENYDFDTIEDFFLQITTDINEKLYEIMSGKCKTVVLDTQFDEKNYEQPFVKIIR